MNLCSGYKGICGVISGWKEVQVVSEPEQSVCSFKLWEGALLGERPCLSKPSGFWL